MNLFIVSIIPLSKKNDKASQAWLITILTSIAFQFYHTSQKFSKTKEFYDSWENQTKRLDEIRKATNWNQDEILRRVLFCTQTDCNREGEFTYASLISSKDLTLKSAETPPCGILLIGGLEESYENNELTNIILGPYLASNQDINFLDKFNISGKDLLIRYSCENCRCITNGRNRYFLTPEEKIIRNNYGEIPLGKMIFYKSNLNNYRFIGNLDGAVYILLDLKINSAGLTIFLHSNQLRGFTDISVREHSLRGFFEMANIQDPKLIFKNKKDENENFIVPIYNGKVGLFGVKTPIKTNPFPIKQGFYQISFEYRTEGNDGKIIRITNNEYLPF